MGGDICKGLEHLNGSPTLANIYFDLPRRHVEEQTVQREQFTIKAMPDNNLVDMMCHLLG